MSYKKVSATLIVILILIVMYLIWFISAVQKSDRKVYDDKVREMIIEAAACDLKLSLNTINIDSIREDVSDIQDLSKASLKYTGPLIMAESEDEVSSLTYSLMRLTDDIIFKIEKIKETIDDIPSAADDESFQ